MNTDIIKLYKQLEDMEQTREIVQLRNSLRETLYEKLRTNLYELISIGRVIGYDELQSEMKKANDLIELQKK